MFPLLRLGRWLLAFALLVPYAGRPAAAPMAAHSARAVPLAPLADGLFDNSDQALAGETGNGVALGDLDRDGDVDALVANDYDAFEGGAIHLWLNGGDGTFTSGDVLSVNTADAYGVAVGDLDGDGDQDAITAGEGNSSRVWLNQGGSQAGTEGDFAVGDTLGAFSTYGVALGDVDNDTDLDALAVGNSNQVWLNDGAANFTAGPALPFLFSRSAALAHLDGDGYLDAAIADSGSGSTQVWWNDGNWSPGPGSFTAGQVLATTQLISALSVADLDDDTAQDIFLAGSGPDQIFWNEGARFFSTVGPLPLADSSWGVAVDDVDGDQLPDVVVGNISGDPNRLWQNLGGRVLTVTQEFGDELGLYWARALAMADLTGDDAPDLFEVTTAEDRVWFNLSVPPVIPNQPGWQTQILDTRGDAGYASSLAVDAAGHPHISYIRRYDDPDETVSYLTYARWDGVRWHSEVVSTNVSGGTALALDANGNPHIAAVTDQGDALSYAHWNGLAWQMQIVDSLAFPQSLEIGSLTIDSSGSPHLVYNTFSNSSPAPELLNYAHWDGAAWQIETIENSLIYDSVLALDTANTPHVGYAVRDAFDTYVVKYGVRSGAGWQVETIDGDVPDAGVFVASLALDAGGNPHLGYVLDNFNSGDVVKYAYRSGGGWTVQPITTVDPDADIQDLALDLDSSDRPHLAYYLADSPADTHWIRYAHWNGTAWQEATLDSGEEPAIFRDQLVAMALDGAGNLHASYYESHYEDLRYVTWAPNWQIRPLPETGLVRSPAVDVGSTLAGVLPHIAYYNQSGGQVIQATWDDDWTPNPLDFVSAPVEDVALVAGTQYEHISYYDADNQRLMYGYWDGAAWNPEIVDEAGDVGRYNDLLLAGHSDGAPRIAYWDATSLRIKLARPDPAIAFWQIYPNNAGPALNATSGPLSAADLSGGDVGVSYYDGVNGDLRLAVWDVATGNWTDELVDGASADVGRLNSLQTDFTDGAPVIAYLGQGGIRWAYKLGGLWQTQVVPGTDGEAITALSLELALDSRQRARIAYTTASGGVYVAHRRAGGWQIEVIAASGAAAPSDLSSALDSRLHVAYVRAGTGLDYAFRTANLDLNLSVPLSPASPYGGGYNPLDPCADMRDSAGGSAGLRRPVLFTPPAAGALSLLQAGPLGDESVFGAMGGVFAATPAGLSYINLYNQHGSEMGQIGLDDPALLWDAYGTLQNFMPGLEALVTGRGDEFVVTQEMVDDALDIWQRLAADGSPALGAAINAELVKYGNLQDFVGLTFNQWAQAIGVNPPPKLTYLPIMHAP